MTMKMLNGGGTDEETTTPYVAAGGNNDVASSTSGVMNDHHHRVEETHTRSLVKGLTWRFVASFTTIVIAKIVTGETGTSTCMARC